MKWFVKYDKRDFLLEREPQPEPGLCTNNRASTFNEKNNKRAERNDFVQTDELALEWFLQRHFKHSQKYSV